MILIVTTDMGQAIAFYRDRIKGLGRCRTYGRLDGEKARIVPRHQLEMYLRVSDRVTRVICHDFTPTPQEKGLIDVHAR